MNIFMKYCNTERRFIFSNYALVLYFSFLSVWGKKILTDKNRTESVSFQFRFPTKNCQNAQINDSSTYEFISRDSFR